MSAIAAAAPAPRGSRTRNSRIQQRCSSRWNPVAWASDALEMLRTRMRARRDAAGRRAGAQPRDPISD